MGQICFKAKDSNNEYVDDIDTYDAYMRERHGTLEGDSLANLSKFRAPSASMQVKGVQGPSAQIQLQNQNNLQSKALHYNNQNGVDQSVSTSFGGSSSSSSSSSSNGAIQYAQTYAQHDQNGGQRLQKQQTGEAFEVIEINDDGSIQNSNINPLRKYRFIRVIGRGAFGKVWLIESLDSHIMYAMKVVKKQQVQINGQRTYLRNEKEIMQNMMSPFIVPLRCAFQSPSKLFMVMEFMQGGSLFTHLRQASTFRDNMVRFYAAELMLALDYLHQRNIIYRDIKPENVLIAADGHIKLTDFGLSKVVSSRDQRCYTIVGTYDYMAPEIYTQSGHSFEVDWYSLGVLIFEMLAGAPPFYNQDHIKMMQDRLRKPLEWPSYFTQDAISLLSQMLQVDPMRRPKFDQIKNHPFFAQIDWTSMVLKRVQPPFKPELSQGLDMRYFQDEFVEEQLRETPCEALEPFEGFTYTENISVQPSGIFGKARRTTNRGAFGNEFSFD